MAYLPLPSPLELAKYRQHLDNWATNYEKQDLSQFAQDFADAVVEAANHAIPHCKRGQHTHSNAWYHSPQVARLKNQLNQAKRNFRRHRNEQSLATLREVATSVKEQLQTIRTEKWLQWCREMSATTSEAGIWHWLGKVAGKQRVRPAPVTCPRTEANRLAELFVSRAAPNTMPQEVQEALTNHRQERLELVQNACATPSPMDKAFTLDELRGAQKMGSNTAPGRDGVVYSLLSHMGPAAETKMLDLSNTSLLSGCVPRQWKTQVTVPIPKRGDMTNP